MREKNILSEKHIINWVWVWVGIYEIGNNVLEQRI